MTDPPASPPRTAPPRARRRRGRRLLAIAGIALVAAVAVKVVWVLALRPDPARLLAGGERADLDARRAYLVSRLTGDPRVSQTMAAPDDGPFRGEWLIGSLSMTAAASTNMAFEHPALLPRAREDVARLLDRALAPDARAFDAQRWREDPLDSLDGPHGHAGYLGHLALMLGANRLLGGEHRFDAQHDRVAAALARRVSTASAAHLETYPGETYAMDNTVVQAALALHQRAGRGEHQAATARWLAHTRRHLLDPRTGLVSFALDGAGRPTQGARGSGAGWNSFYLPFVDEAFAAEQFAALKAHLVLDLPFGGAGVREFPAGVAGSGDVDSGPVVLGISTSGTGFAVAGARHARDARLLGRLLTTAEIVGCTVHWRGQRRYLLAPLVGDAIMLAMKTARPWDRRFLDAK
ncbi:MAG: hypothetical protein HY906_08455 [Deltaproteobacteria bacterium]|nr:hypothetical protein [Deltaproteobacteria bacterium]